MNDRQEQARPDGPRTYPADKARQGDIILRTPIRKAVFIAGLVGFVLLAIISALMF